MKMASAALLLVVLASSVEVSGGFRLLRSPTGKNGSQQVKAAVPKAAESKVAAPKATESKVAAPKATELKAAKATTMAAHAAPPAQAPHAPVVRILKVPVVEVIVTDEGGDMEGEEAQDLGGGGSLTAGVNATCREEMEELTANSSRRVSAEACVDKSNSTQRVIQALQQANSSMAETEASSTLRECGGLSQGCAKQVATRTVLNLRLSGLSVSKVCAGDVVRTARQTPKLAPAEAARCRENVTKAVFQELSSKDIEGALAAAQYGLSMCNNVGHPCDYQLAPVMVMQLMRSASEEEQVQVLMEGLQQAQALAMQIAKMQAAQHAKEGKEANSTVAKGAAGAKKANTSAATASRTAAEPKLSLLSLARHLHRVVAPGRAVTL